MLEISRMSGLFSRLFIAFLCVWTANKCSATPLSRLSPQEPVKTCGYEACPKPVDGKLNIHLIPHTHDDVGWLKTVDQYYWGSRSLIQKAGVQYILDSVIQELLKDPERRFIYVETAYLWKWWTHQTDEIKSDVRRLINEGRLEIISGAWSMNDEAVTHYQSIIDQFTWGFRRLNDTFGSCARPHIGWQIDPFGHSREQASLFAQMGFDGLFLGRIDYQDKRKRLREKTAEMIWKGSESLGTSADLFTHALYNTYSPPPGFCFDVLCADEPVIDDIHSPDYNVDQRIGSLVDYAEEQSKYYRSNNIILTMGGDFTYQDAEMWYKNLDKIVRYANERNGSTVNVFYSTPSCYLKAVNDKALAWPTKSDDFFPYASDPNAYWSGYFSSRPTLKYYERTSNNFLQISKQLSVLGDIESESDLVPLREAMGVMQHHDAITGTEKQQVAQDYARILSEATQGGERIVSRALKKLIPKQPQSPSADNLQFESCQRLNVSACHHTEENQKFVVTLYNPQSRRISTYVRVPVAGKSYSVKDFTGANLVTQIVPIPAGVLGIPGRESSAVNELVFLAVDIPALGYHSYYINEVDAPATSDDYRGDDPCPSTIRNNVFNVTVNDDGSTHITRKTREGAAAEIDLEQTFHYYEGQQGNNMVFTNRSSGAYIFRPKDAVPKNLSGIEPHKVYKGPLVQEFHVKINEWISQVARLYTDEDHVEFDWVAGPIPIEDDIGKEIITRYSSRMDTESVFYTDSNGREMLKRERNFRPTWPLELAEPVAGNYYPVTAKITVEDKVKKVRLSVLNDRAQGGSSLNDGQVELMIHRRLLNDDAFGVGEALNETAYGIGLVARGQHQVLVSETGSETDSYILREKQLAWNMLNPPCLLVSPVGEKTFEDWRTDYRMQGSGLAKDLPLNVRILTLEPWKDGGLLLRLEHIFEAGEDTRFSHPVEINIKDLFAPFTVVSARETTLGGNVWLGETERMSWMTESNEVSREQGVTESPKSTWTADDEAINVLLHPMEMRTFIVKISLN